MSKARRRGRRSGSGIWGCFSRGSRRLFGGFLLFGFLVRLGSDEKDQRFITILLPGIVHGRKASTLLFEDLQSYY